MTTSRGVTDTKIYDSKGVVERYGVPPELVTDLIGLKGDTSDNIPGVPGIGDKTAAQLLQEYGDLEEVLANVDKISGAKRKENLTNHAEDARISKQLATAITDIDVELDLDELMSKRDGPQPAARGGPRVRAARDPRSAWRRSSVRTSSRTRRWTRSSTPPPRRARIDDLGKGDVALAIVGETWSGYDGKKLVEGDCPDFAELAEALGNRRLIGHDLKSLGGGARHGLLAAPDGLDLRHDTMVGAYLLDPARRTYDLIDIAAQRGLAAAPKDADDRRRRPARAGGGAAARSRGRGPPCLGDRPAAAQGDRGRRPRAADGRGRDAADRGPGLHGAERRPARPEAPRRHRRGLRAADRERSRPRSSSWPGTSSPSARRSSSPRSSSTSSA